MGLGIARAFAGAAILGAIGLVPLPAWAGSVWLEIETPSRCPDPPCRPRVTRPLAFEAGVRVPEGVVLRVSLAPDAAVGASVAGQMTPWTRGFQGAVRARVPGVSFLDLEAGYTQSSLTPAVRTRLARELNEQIDELRELELGTELEGGDLAHPVSALTLGVIARVRVGDVGLRLRAGVSRYRVRGLLSAALNGVADRAQGGCQVQIDEYLFSGCDQVLRDIATQVPAQVQTNLDRILPLGLPYAEISVRLPLPR